MSFAQVLLENLPAHIEKDIYTYRIPEAFGQLKPGTQVLVPFGKQLKSGFILRLLKRPPSFAVKPIKDVMSQQYFDEEYLTWLEWIADYYMNSMGQVVSVAIPKRVSGKMKTMIKPLMPPVELLEYMDEGFYPADLIDFVKYLLSGFPQLKTLNAAQRKFKLHQEYLKVLQEHRIFDVVKVMSEAPKPKTQLFITFLKHPMNASTRQEEILRRLQQLGGHVALAIFCRQANTTSTTLRKLEEIGAVSIQEERLIRIPHEDLSTDLKGTNPVLTLEQQKAFQVIKEALLNPPEHPAVLLHGVTGSGKTEVYMAILDELLEINAGAIVLVPEISLTPMMLKRFRGRFGSNVALIHSGLSQGEYMDEWHRIKTGLTKIVIGARSAVFAPVNQLKLIILDEEHDGSYKQDSFLRYDTRLIALERVKRLKGLLILGSATPRVESFYAAKSQKIQYVKMAKRVHKKPLPPVHLVDMREERELGNFGVFSHLLQEQIKNTIEREEQVILLLNRRGFASSFLCRSCGYAVYCPQCDVSMTYHKLQGLKCHYCDYQREAPRFCPECQNQAMQPFGLGTQKLEGLIHKLYPNVKTLRMDRDTTSRKNAHFDILKQFENHEAQILIGTQMVAKGLDFHRVTLVGILSADLALNLPDFRAGEKTFQLLTQAAGRAGRGERQGQIILQTYAPEHNAIQNALKHDYEAFYADEILSRKTFLYPPFTLLIKIVFLHSRAIKAMEIADVWKQTLEQVSGVQVLGPAPSPISKIQNVHRIQMLIKTMNLTRVKKALWPLRKKWEPELFRLIIDINPLSML